MFDDEKELEMVLNQYKLLEQTHVEQTKILTEIFVLVYRTGLLEHLSDQAKTYLTENEFIAEAIRNGNVPSLEPRLSPEEYVKHIISILDVSKAQYDFVTFIVQVCYIMILAEKNPLIAQELRGVLNVSDVIKSVVKIR